MPDLTPFEGKDVIAVGIELPGAAGGLQEAMKFDPVELHQGEDGYVVLHFVTKKVRFDPVSKENYAGPQRRVQILDVDSAALIDAEVVAEHLAKQKERIALAKEKEKGVERIPGIDSVTLSSDAGSVTITDEDAEAIRASIPLADEDLGDTGTE